jgi:hypothetical protein
MRTNADKAATYALAALRALGNIIHKSGARWLDNASSSSSVPLTGAARWRARRAQQQQHAVHTALPLPSLVLHKWGAFTASDVRMWFGVLRALLLGGANAALVDAAKANTRTR